jgi:hypothetical protein
MRSITLLYAAILLAGCAGQMIEQGMTSLVGQPLNAAIATLGVPTEERTIADMKVYVWSTSTVVEGTQRKCTIRAIMKGDVIGSFDFEGNEGRCARYAQLLQRQLQSQDCRKGISDTRMWLLPCS